MRIQAGVVLGAVVVVCACGPSDAAAPRVVTDTSVEVALVSYLGGAGKESARDAAMDEQGNLYLTGGTETPDFPTTEGAFDRSHNGWQDVWVAKLSPDGKISWCTFLGGPGYDRAYGIEIADDGSVLLAGRAGEGFPTTPGSLQPGFGGDEKPSNTYGKQDGFVAKLSSDGSELLWSTYFGVEDGSNIRDLDVDREGAVYLAADTAANPLNPYVTEGAFQTTPGGARDALVVKLAPDGSHVVYGTYLGGSGRDGGSGSIRVTEDGRAYLLAHTHSDDMPVTEGALQPARGGEKDLFLARLSADGSSLELLTYFGGEGADNSETHGLSLASDGSAYITATAQSSNLPPCKSAASSFQARYGGTATSRKTGKRTNYPGDAFVARVSSDGRELLGFTYFGGSQGEGIEGSAVDSEGRVWISGGTHSQDLPVAPNAHQRRLAGASDAFLACFSPDLSACLWATYLGGSEVDVTRSIAAGPSGVAAAGVTYSGDLVVTENALRRERGAESDILLVLLTLE